MTRDDLRKLEYGDIVYYAHILHDVSTTSRRECEKEEVRIGIITSTENINNIEIHKKNASHSTNMDPTITFRAKFEALEFLTQNLAKRLENIKAIENRLITKVRRLQNEK